MSGQDEGEEVQKSKLFLKVPSRKNQKINSKLKNFPFSHFFFSNMLSTSKPPHEKQIKKVSQRVHCICGFSFNFIANVFMELHQNCLLIETDISSIDGKILFEVFSAFQKSPTQKIN